MFAIPVGGGRGGAVKEQYLRLKQGRGAQTPGIRTGILVLVVGKERNWESGMVGFNHCTKETLEKTLQLRAKHLLPRPRLFLDSCLTDYISFLRPFLGNTTTPYNVLHNGPLQSPLPPNNNLLSN